MKNATKYTTHFEKKKILITENVKNTNFVANNLLGHVLDFSPPQFREICTIAMTNVWMQFFDLNVREISDCITLHGYTSTHSDDITRKNIHQMKILEVLEQSAFNAFHSRNVFQAECLNKHSNWNFFFQTEILRKC